ncbi:MAG: hypothetical protein E6Q41_04540 [Cyclobacteriaceae bacterium]|nr:MAG: hypothetical protein E6Q41_04540 [Cyclobacteriaceae bacterium]
MNKPILSYLTVFIFLFISQISFGQRFWVAAGASNWNNTANWSTTSGGAGGASVPGPSDAVTFNASGLGNCTLDVAPNVAGITVNGYTGVINLNGFNLTTTGTNSFVTGTINNGGAAAAVTLNTAGTTTFSGTTFGANVNGSTGRIFFNGSVFNGSVTVTKTANNNDTSTGGNTFSGSVTLTNSSTNQFRLGGTNPDIFNGALALVSGNTGPLEVAYSSAANQINNNVTVTYNATGLISIGAGGGTATLAATRTISVAGFGASGCGNLTLARLTQAGATAQNISLGGNDTATLTLGPASNFSGTLTITTPSIIFNSSSFQAVTVTKTGSAIDNSRGGNTFNGVMTVNNQGGDFAMGTNSADAGDTWNASAFFNNTGGNRIRIGEDNAGNVFQANATFTNTSATDIQSRIQISRFGSASVTFNGTTTITNNAAGGDIHISYDAGSSTTFNGPLIINSNAGVTNVENWIGNTGDVMFNGNVTITSSDRVAITNGNGLANMTAGNTINIGGGGFTGSELAIRNFTQAGSTAMNLALTGATSLLRFTNSTIGGNVTFSSPQFILTSSVFNGTASITKIGASDNYSSGNTFNGVTTITNNGSSELFFGNGAADTFNAATTFNNTGSFRIRIAWNHNGATTTFANNLTLNSNKSGGTDQWSFLVGENTNSNVAIGGDLIINCAGTLRSDHRFLNGLGSTLDLGGNLIINNTNSDPGTIITMGVNGTTTYNGNITLTNTGGSNGVTFNSGASASATQAAGGFFTIAGGFDSGVLNIQRFTQAGASPINLTLGGTTTLLRVGPSTTFGGNADLRAPQLYLDGVSIAGTAYLEKNGSINNTGQGNNTFGSTTTIVNNGSGVLRTNGNNTFNGATSITNNSNGDILLELASGSTYNGSVTLLNTSTSNIRMAYAGTTTFNGNIILNSTGGTGIAFCESGAATATLSAGNTISIGASGFSSGTLSLPRFTQLGATPQTLTAFSGTTTLTLGPSSSFGGNVTFTAPRLFLNGCTYSGTATLEKNGASDDAGAGGNTFEGVTTITNSGNGYLLTGNINRDQFNAATTFNNTGSYRIYFAHNHGGQTTTFASDLTLNSNKSGGTDAWSYFMGEGANIGLTVAGTLTINAGGSIQSNHRLLQGTGGTAVFQGPVNINVTNTAAGTVIKMGENGTTTYNGNINVINSGGASGVTFNGQTAASSILNGVITAGTFSSGSLNLYRFTQVGALPENITLTGTSIMRVGPNSAFGGDVNFVSPRMFLNGATYNSTASFEKTGTGDDASNGGNIFNGTTTLINSSSAIVYMANVSPDIFNGQLTITNSGSNWIFMAHNVAGNQFNNNITVNNTGSALGIIFSNSATGASTFTNGTINVGGSGFATGQLRFRRFSQVGAFNQNLTLTGSALLWLGPTSAFDGNVNFVAPRVLLNGTTYNGTTYIEKNGASNDAGDGGNIFNQPTTLVNSGNGYFMSANVSPDVFNNSLIVTNSGSSTVQLSENSPGNQYNGNIQLNSTFGGGIYFGNNVNGTSTLAATRTIGVGGSGVLSGDIRLIRFTQVGATAQTLDLTGIAILTLGPASTFDGSVDFRAPQLLLNGTTYNGTAYLEKKGAGDNPGSGGNTFNGATSLVNSGSGYLLTANTSPDIFNNALTVTNTGSNVIYLAHNVAGNQFNGNITFNSTLGSAGVYFSNNAAGSSTLGNGASLLVGGLGYSSGELRFRRFTQVGAAAQTLLLTGTAYLRIGPSSTFNGNLDFRAPQIALEGAIYNGTTYLEKTGANNNDSNGGNTFNGSTTIANSGSGWFRFALTALDTFNGDLTLTNTGSSTIRMADNFPGTVFNGNITVNSTFGGGIFFSESGGGTATLAAGRTISTGGLGFSLGELRLRRFTQTGATPQTLLLTGTATLVLGPTISFDGAADFRAPQLLINGGIFNGAAFLEKTGATSNTGTGNTTFNGATTIQVSSSGYLRTNGGNTFNGVTNLINSGSNDLLLELTTASVYNNTVTMTNTGSSYIRPAYIGSNTFNGDIIVNSTSGTGIYFSENAAGSATLASGRTISVGGTGFTAGELRLQRFTQFGATAQNLALTGSAILRTGPSATWNGNLTASSPALFLDGATFNGANTFTKTGASTDASAGGNVFVGASTFINSGTGIFRLGNVSVDEFIGAVTFNQASGTLQPAYNSASNFYNHVTVNGPAAITFGANNGTIVFAGGAAQNVSKTGAASPVFRRLTMNKSGNSVTLNTDASVTTNGTFTNGVMLTTSTNILNFANGATVTGGSNVSHIDGPVRKTGTNAFSFPTGDGGFYRPISISAPSNAAHFFTAEYFKAGHAFGGPSTYAAGIVTVSSCEYWMLDRNPAVGGSNVSVTLSWNTPDCTGPYITNPANLRVVRWNGTAWVNHGNGGTTGNATNGTVISAGVITSFSPITLGSSGLDNPLPVELISFTGTAENEKVNLKWVTASELNNDFFTVQHSTDGVEFESLGVIDGQGTKQSSTTYNFVDATPMAGVNYYRLKQTDFDGASSYSNIVAVNLDLEWLLYPNPATHGTDVSINKKGDYAVYNNLGVLVMKLSDASKFDISSLAPGIYTVRSSNGSIRRLVVK